MRIKHKAWLNPNTEVNLSPLMDLAFSLLIIFMISTPLLEQTIPISLPTQDKNSASERPDIKFQVISINKDSQIFWGRQPVTLEELNRLLGILANEKDPPAISLRADRSLRYQEVIDVLDAIKRNNLTKLHLDTEVK